MNIKAISTLEHSYTLKTTDKLNTITPKIKSDVVELSSSAMSFKGIEKKEVQAYRKLAKTHAKEANNILKTSDADIRYLKNEIGMPKIILQEVDGYKRMSFPRYETAISLLSEVESDLNANDNCADFGFSDGTIGRYIRFEQDNKKGLTIIKPATGIDAEKYEPMVVTKFGEEIMVTTKMKNGLERIFTFDKDGNLQKFEQNGKGDSRLYKNVVVLYADGQLVEYKEKDSTFNNHYAKKYVCEDGKITKVYISGSVDAKGCLIAGDAYFLEDENKPVWATGYHDNQNGQTTATSEVTFVNGEKGEYKISEYMFRMAKNPQGKVESSKIYRYYNDKLSSMSIGQFVSQSGREVASEYYVCDENGKPKEVLLNAKFDESNGEVISCDKQIPIALSSKIAEVIEDFKMSW